MRTTRRDFLKNVTLGGTVISSAGLFPEPILSKETSGSNKIVYRQLGSTGFKVSEIGFGAMNMRDPELVRAAIDSGINYIDTAHAYMKGVNEEIIGSVMKSKRDKVFLTTKISGRDPGNLPNMLETSLKRLKTDHVDLLLLHNIKSTEPILNHDIIKFFDNARKKGYTRYVGFSTHNFQGEFPEAALKDKFWEAVLVAYNYFSPLEIGESIKKVREAGLAVIAMKSLLHMEYGPSHESRAAGDKASTQQIHHQDEPIGDIRKDKKSSVTPTQALLKWALNNPYVDTVIPGMTSMEHVAEDVAVMGMKLSFNDKAILQRFSENKKKRYCHGLNGCEGCRDKCPFGVEVKEINRCLGYAYGYKDMELALENYRELPFSVDRCSNCDECAVKCINGLPLTDNIREAKKLFA
jgi:uncharacterized protein